MSDASLEAMARLSAAELTSISPFVIKGALEEGQERIAELRLLANELVEVRKIVGLPEGTNNDWSTLELVRKFTEGLRAKLKKTEDRLEKACMLLGRAIWKPTMGSELEHCVFCEGGELSPHREGCEYQALMEEIDE